MNENKASVHTMQPSHEHSLGETILELSCKKRLRVIVLADSLLEPYGSGWEDITPEERFALLILTYNTYTKEFFQ